MSLPFKNTRAGQVTKIQIRGGAGIGFCLLHIDIVADLHPASASPMTAHITGGSVTARRQSGGSDVRLGSMYPESGSPTAQPSKPSGAVTWQFCVELSPERLSALERIRAGGDLCFG